MKILVVCPNLKFGGAEKNTVNLVNSLYEEGLDVSVALLNKEGELLEDIKPDIEVISLDQSRSRYAFYRFRKVLKQSEPDVVLSMIRESSLMTSLSLCFLKKKPFFIIREACHFEEKGSIYAKVVSFCYSKSDLFISNSQSSLRTFKEAKIIENVPSKVIYNPVLSDNFFDTLKFKPNHKWLDDDSITCFITGGRLEKTKNIDQVIKAFYSLSLIHDDFRLVILGEGSERKALQTLTDELQLSDKIDFMGFVKYPATYISSSDLFIMASDNEGFGNMLVEAMACGVKVLARNSGGPVEILKNGSIGILKDLKDEADLAQEMEDALIRNQDVKSLKNRAEDFTVSKIIQEYIAILNEI